MLPPVPAISQESESSSSLENHEQEAVNANITSVKGDREELSGDDDSNRSTSVPRENEVASPQVAIKDNKSLVSRGFLNTSTDDDSLVNHHFLESASSLRLQGRKG